MKTPQKVARLAKFLAYVLGRRPDEFGLLPDENGYVKVKDLLKALNEESGWRHVRRAHLREVLLTCRPADIEIDNERIRALSRDHLPSMAPALAPPKQLYTCVRRKAYPRVHARGIYPAAGIPVVLASEPELALRMGRRKDSEPVLLAVNTARSQEAGVVYMRYGEVLFAADYIAPGTFTGPPLPKEPPAASQPKVREPSRPAADAGSFLVDPRRLSPSDPDHKNRRKKSDWKRERRQQRRHKQKKMWEP